MDFEAWQKQERAIIGCTKEQHDRLIEIASEIAATGAGGNAYEAIRAIIYQPPNFSIPLIPELPPSPQPVRYQFSKRYQSKKARRVL